MRIVYVLFAVMIIFASYLRVQMNAHPQLRYNSLTDRILHPFDTRLRFHVERVDSGFNITSDEVINLSKEAIDIWHQGTGKDDLLIYDENAKLGIQLIYDHRQMEYQASKQNQQKLDDTLDQNEKFSQSLQQRLQYLNNRSEELEHRRTEISHAFRNINQQQQSWSRLENEDGPNRVRIKSEYQQLKFRSQQLDQEFEMLKLQTDEYNRDVEMHNQNIDSYNVNVGQYNQRFAEREFHKGTFDGEKINIYQFDTNNDLKITIAHELGHALGLSHNSEPTALMFPMLKEQNIENFRLHPADVLLLSRRKN